MAKRKRTKSKRKIHQKRKRNWLFRREILLVILAISLVGTGIYLKDQLSYYYAMNFKKSAKQKLHNTEAENKRIQRIISENTDKIFGIDLSHYQETDDVQWDSLSIANQSIPIRFVVLRATMGEKKVDRHFDHFWNQAQKHNLIRGAYHFYRVDEDPVLQAQNFLETVKLESGDLRPVLDIEKISRRQSKEKLINHLKTWLKIVEEAYGEKPIIYTYYHYYKDYLRDDFSEYPLWLANYNDVSTPSPTDPWELWQFSEKGIVHGVNTKVDLNLYNGGSWKFNSLKID